MSFRQSVVTFSTKVLDAIRAALPENTHNVVLGMATAVENEYRANAPRDTGSMAESVYVNMKDGAYQFGKKTSEIAIRSQALSLNPNAIIIPSPDPTNKNGANVAPIVGHFPFVEYGTTHMAARPTMAQSIVKVKSQLGTRHKDLFTKLVTGK